MKVGKKIRNAIESTDIFGDPIYFTINNEEKPKTLLGGILTTTLVTLMTILFIIQVRDPLERVSPKISSYINVNPVVGKMNFNMQNMPFAFTVTDDEGNFYEDLIHISAKTIKYKVENSEWIEYFEEFEMTKCTKDYFPNTTIEEFNGYGIQNYNCIKNQNVTIAGYINGIDYTGLSFRANFCKENREGNKITYEDNCDVKKQKEKLKEKGVKSIFVSLYFINNVFNSRNYGDFLEYYTENLFSYLDIEKIKYITLSFNRQNLVTDDGLIWNTETNKTIISMESYIMDTTPSYFDENLLTVIMVHPSNKEYTSIRTYDKIPSVMADVKALFEYIRFALKIFCVIFANSKKKILVMNNLFEFDFRDPMSKVLRNLKVKMSLKHLKTEKGNAELIKDNYAESKDDTNINKNFSKTNSNSSSNYFFNEEHESDIKKQKIPNKIKSDLLDFRRRSDILMYSNINKKKLHGKYILGLDDENKTIDKNLDTSQAKEENRNKLFPTSDAKITNEPDQNYFHNSITRNNLNNNYNINNKGKYIYVMNKSNKRKMEWKDYYGKRKEINKKKKLHLTNMEKIKINLFCSCIKNKSLRIKYDLYRMAEKKMLDMFEITYVMDKLEEVEKLKAVLFEKEQLAMFNMLMGEPCSLNPDVLRNHEYKQLKEYQLDSYKHNIEIEKFRKKMNDEPEKLNDIDDRLFRLLPIEIKDFLLADKNNEGNQNIG